MQRHDLFWSLSAEEVLIEIMIVIEQLNHGLVNAHEFQIWVTVTS